MVLTGLCVHRRRGGGGGGGWGVEERGAWTGRPRCRRGSDGDRDAVHDVRPEAHASCSNAGCAAGRGGVCRPYMAIPIPRMQYTRQDAWGNALPLPPPSDSFTDQRNSIVIGSMRSARPLYPMTLPHTTPRDCEACMCLCLSAHAHHPFETVETTNGHHCQHLTHTHSTLLQLPTCPAPRTPPNLPTAPTPLLEAEHAALPAQPPHTWPAHWKFKQPTCSSTSRPDMPASMTLNSMPREPVRAAAVLK